METIIKQFANKLDTTQRKVFINNHEITDIDTFFKVAEENTRLLEQVKKQKEAIDKTIKLINHYLKNTDESGSYVETNTRWKLIPEILKELEDILKEVSE